jgi:catechol 2,3-dioxygenase-like lactoylglutathione lyase family enzyme
MIKGIAHICTVSKDLAATERFYCSGLKLKKAFDFVKGGEVIGFYLEAAKGVYIEVFRSDKIDPNANGAVSHVSFEVDDIDETGHQLKSQGYEVTKKSLGPDHTWQSWTSDPSGVKIEFHQYTPTSCQYTGENCKLD